MKIKRRTTDRLRQVHGYAYDPAVTDPMNPHHQVRARELHEIRTQLWMLTTDIDKIKRLGTITQLTALIKLLQSTQFMVDTALTHDLTETPWPTRSSRTKTKP